MKFAIEHASRKVSFKVSSNSNFSIFEVGTHKMENTKIVDNIATATEQLKEKWPGGWKNILRLYLKPMRQSKVSIPLYYSKINPNDVEVPVEVGVKQTRLDKINEQLAKRSKKLRIDRKTKKIVKVKVEKPKGDKVVGEKKKKDKKRKLTDATKPTEVKSETASEEPKAKKEKKVSVSEAPVIDESAPKKKKKKNTESAAVAAEPKTEPETVVKKADKKKKSKSVEAAPVEEVKSEETQKDKKKKNKKNK